MKIPSDESVAWFFMGEGSATFVCSRRKEKMGLMSILGYRLDPRIAFTNTDPDLLEPMKVWLDSKEVAFTTDTQKRRKPKYWDLLKVEVRRHKDVKNFLWILIPFLRGRKRRVCELVLECLVKYDRGDWKALMKEKVVRDKKTGKIMGVNWDVKEERERFLRMMKYRDKIVKINSSRAKEKYNYDYFSNLWGMTIE